MSGAAGAWQLFERDPAGNEAWYATPRGQRADRAERALLECLLAPFVTAQSALEVGCGTGHFTRWLAGRLPRVAGLDRAVAMLVEAQRRHPGLPLVHGDARHLPIRSRAIDLSVFVLTWSSSSARSWRWQRPSGSHVRACSWRR
jgi:trans-aconitate methyltransferase